MNLTNYRSTPIARVVELIPPAAARYGVGVHHSELVGLVPARGAGRTCPSRAARPV